MQDDQAGGNPARWHADSTALARYVADLVAAEMTRQRPGGSGLPPQPWSDDLTIAEGGLGLDSLERLTVASVVSEALHLHESGIADLLLARPRFGDWLEIAETGLARHDARLTFRTSGSTGTPKSCTHSRADLEQEAAYLASVLIGCRRVISAVPAHHIYGFLFTVMLPAQLRCHSVLDVRQLTPHALRHLLRGGDLIVSHPAHWALLARHGVEFPDDVTGVSSTAPCSDELARSLHERGLMRLMQIYGSSETGGIGWRDATGAPYRLMPFWTRDAADDTRLVRHALDGSQHRLDAGDHLAWHGDACFSVGERRDEAVQVAGTNVYPQHVGRVLRAHPQVAGASVRLMAPHEGQRLKAYIVPVAGADAEALRVALTQWVNTRLTPAERPKAFTMGSSLPRNEAGKLADWMVCGEVTQCG